MNVTRYRSKKILWSVAFLAAFLLLGEAGATLILDWADEYVVGMIRVDMRDQDSTIELDKQFNTQSNYDPLRRQHSVGLRNGLKC